MQLSAALIAQFCPAVGVHVFAALTVTLLLVLVALHPPEPTSQRKPKPVSVPTSPPTVVYEQLAWLALFVNPLVHNVWLAAHVPGVAFVIAFVLQTVR